MAEQMQRDTTNNIWPKDIEIEGAGWTPTYTFNTLNKFVDANIVVRAHANAAGNLTLALTDLTSNLTMGSATSGVYSPTVSLTGTVTPASAGWITASAATVTDSSVKIGKINQSTLKNGNTAINSGTTVNPTSAAQTINISEGYNTARTVILGPVSAGPKGTIKSGTASLGALTYTYNENSDNFTITGTASITAPTVPTPGYVSSDADASKGGTKQINSNSVSQSVDVITVGSAVDGTFTKPKPILTRTAKSSGSWIDAASGAEVDSTTANKPYVQVDAAAVAATLVTKGTVTAAGYGTASVYNTATSLSTDVGTQVADSIFIPIKIGSIKSPNTTATFTNPTLQTTGPNTDKFTIIASGTIGAPTISAEGYISSVVGTKSGGTISGTKVLNKITVGATIASDSSDGTVTPVISRTPKPTDDTWIDAASGAATGTKPTSGVYVQVDAPKISKTVTINGTVASEGYGTTSLYNPGTALTVTAGSAAAATKYIPITQSTGYSLNVTSISGSTDVTVGTKNTSTNKYPIKASNISVTGTLSASTHGWFSSSGSVTDSRTDNVTIGNMPAATFAVSAGTVTCSTPGYVPQGTVGQIATKQPVAVATDPGNSYTNNTSVVLESGGWLKLDAGYYAATRISLATLVPNGSNIQGHADYLLEGKTAYDNNGILVTGTIATYQGEYTVA